jgi:hypothetical protein
LIASAGMRQPVVDKSTIPGSPMDWRWENPARSNPADARYGILILNERVPLSGTMPWHNSTDFALRWFNHA